MGFTESERLMYARLIIVLVLTAAVLYLLLWPVPIDPAAWDPPAAPALEGIYEPNHALAEFEPIGGEIGTKPETIVVDADDRIYGGTEEGIIWRTPPGGAMTEAWANTAGRPLGMAFDADGNLIVVDSFRGVISVDPEGEVTVLSTESDGLPYKFADDLDIADDGTIYFSDASWKFGQFQYIHDIIEHRGNGRLLAYDPDTGETTTLLDDLYFANGVAVGHDQRYVLVVETSKYRVMRYWLDGSRAGAAEVFIDNLPGFPDNISRGTDGIYWLAIASPRDPVLDFTLPRPFLRKVIMRLPEFLRPSIQRYGMVLGINTDAEVVYNLQDPDGGYAPITSATEFDGWLYFGSILEQGAARMRRPE